MNVGTWEEVSRYLDRKSFAWNNLIGQNQDPDFIVFRPHKYGPIGVGSDAAAIQAAINAASSAGGVVLLEAGTYSVATALTVTSSHVRIVGKGLFSTSLKWTGTVGGTLLTVGDGVNPVYGFGLDGVGLLGNSGNADKVLYLQNVWHSRLHQLYLKEVTGVAFHAVDFQNCVVENVLIDQENYTGTGFIADGSSSSANTNYSIFDAVFIIHKNGVGADLKNCDNLKFNSFRCVQKAGGVGTGIFLRASNTGGVECRANYFQGVQANGGIICEGTAAGSSTSHGNWFYGIDSENSTPDPTINTGATAFFTRDADPLRITVAQSGSMAMPNGLIMKWGQGNGINPTISFATAFPTTCWQVIATARSTNADPVAVNTITVSTFVAQTGGFSLTVGYVAFGN